MSGYLPPGCTQQECDEAQPGYWDPPEIEVACDMCGGAGQFEVPYPYSKWSTDPHGCTVEPCGNCEGRGFFICEAEPDTSPVLGRDKA